MLAEAPAWLADGRVRLCAGWRGRPRPVGEQRGHDLDPDLARRLEHGALRRLPLADFSKGPFFAHDDFQPGNLLAARASGALALTGLLDFGNARAADPLFDLAKALFCCKHEDPACERPLLEGYGAIDHPDVEGVLWLYTLYHRLGMWVRLIGLGVDPTNGPDALLRDLRAMA
jgi:aminoglycoside phosphotransferase (APT) family kinase protein